MSEPGIALTTPALLDSRERGTKMADRTCSADGCERQATAVGLCGMHYQRLRAHGDASFVSELMLSFEERFAVRTERASNGCLLWRDKPRELDRDGYPRVMLNRRKTRVARWAYEHFVGPIPDGLQLDHVCHTNDPSCAGGACVHRRCVEPSHLEPVTIRENALRRHRRSPAGVEAG